MTGLKSSLGASPLMMTPAASIFAAFDRLLLCAVLGVASGGLLRAQFTDPRTYNNSPVGINQFTIGYGYAHANASIDSSLVITGAKLNLNSALLDYTRGVSFFHRYAWLEASVPAARLDGAVTGTAIQGSVSGAGDAAFVVGTLLKGGPALGVRDFDAYEPATTLGASVTITAPTGLYRADRILNLGSHRWSFKPEFAVSHPFGPNHNWEIDGYANATFFSDNTSYHGRQLLGQDPIPGFEGHLSYSFTENIWASLDTRYSFRGDTILNGIDQDNSQRNFALGSEVNVSLSPQHSLLLLVAKGVLHRNGPASADFAVKYIFSWGHGLK
jgi:hypothetical protein